METSCLIGGGDGGSLVLPARDHEAFSPAYLLCLLLCVVWGMSGKRGGERERERRVPGGLGESCTLRTMDTRELISLPGLTPPTSCFHFKLELIQTCCSWKEAISTGPNRKMICKGIWVWESGAIRKNETREQKRWINRGWWRREQDWKIKMLVQVGSFQRREWLKDSSWSKSRADPSGLCSLLWIQRLAIKMCLFEIFQVSFPQICIFFLIKFFWTKGIIQELCKEHKDRKRNHQWEKYGK